MTAGQRRYANRGRREVSLGAAVAGPFDATLTSGSTHRTVGPLQGHSTRSRDTSPAAGTCSTGLPLGIGEGGTVVIDGTVRLWPMPEGRPFHTLPYEELLDRLRALTNLRLRSDEESFAGYALDVDPFPGWETVPTW